MVTVLARGTGNPDWEYYAKPALMPLLAIWFVLVIRENGNSAGKLEKLTLGALFFSWLGDLFLMGSGAEIWFLLGLGSFLVGHICYVFAFTTGPFVSDNKKQSWVKKNPWAILLFVVYAAGLLYTLRNGIEGFLWLAVPIYAFAIAMMALSAMNRKLKVPSVSYSLTLSGALIFVASDSTIALDRFGSEYLGDFQGAGAIIMLTYTVAQLLIVAGILSQRSENAVKE